MQIGKIPAVAAIVACLAFAFTPSGFASTYSAVVVYGDSLSDNGNLFAASGGTIPAAPYYNGRFSNGPVAVEYLAAALGAPLLDFAYGGATTGVGNTGDLGTQTTAGLLGLPGMFAEVIASGSVVPPSIVSSSLFVVWGGANDFESGGSVTTAVADIDLIVQTLEGAGATHILVPGLPDLGLTPEFYNNATATAFSTQFNQLLQATLPGGATYFDTFGTLNAIIANPGAYGFNNVTGQCYPGDFSTPGLTPCANPSQYLFWDDIHPTTAADAILARGFLGAVTTPAPTPEPGSIVLLGTGVVGMAGMLRRRLAGSR